MWVVFSVLGILFIKTVWLNNVLKLLPSQELKRRARSGDRRAAAIFRPASLGRSLDLTLMLAGAASATAAIVMAARFRWWGGVLVLLAAAAILFWLPRPKESGWSWRVAAWESPVIFKFVDLLAPILRPLVRVLPSRANVHIHSGLYEKQDLLNLLSNQARQLDNRIAADDLKIAVGALTFGDKKVAEVMIPRRQVRFVAADETVGPMLMDELHKTGFNWFPVVKTQPAKNTEPEVVGALQLNDLLINLEKGGRVSELMHAKPIFINEASSLHQALDAVTKKHLQLLVVVNNFEEVVGVLTLQDIIGQILGQALNHEFDNYDDLRSVAALAARHNQATHHTIEPAKEPVEKK